MLDLFASGWLGLPLDRLSALQWLIPWYSYHALGGSYPRGGSPELHGYAWVGAPAWSEDGTQIGYLARRGSQGIVVHGKGLTALDGAVEGSLILGERGRWACVAAYPSARRFYVVIDGVPRVPFDMDELTAEVARRPYGELLAGAEGAIFRRWVSAELKMR